MVAGKGQNWKAARDSIKEHTSADANHTKNTQKKLEFPSERHLTAHTHSHKTHRKRLPCVQLGGSLSAALVSRPPVSGFPKQK